MSKRTKTLLAALIALALLVGLLFAVKLLMPKEADSSSSETSSTSVKLVSLSSEEVASVQVSRSEGGYTLRQKNGEATIDGLEGLPLDSDRTKSVITQAASMTAKEMVDENPSSLGLYGWIGPIIL